MTEQPKFTRSEPAGLEDENALLRASIADLRERLAEFEQTADCDPLTRLANHRRLIAELDRLVGMAQRYGVTAALLLIEFDSLQDIADRHGTLAGDAALIHVARLLEDLIRSTDTAARIGPGRFAVTLDFIDHDSAIDAAERLARCIMRDPLDLGGAHAALGVTIGVAGILPGDIVEDILRRAEGNLARVREDA